MKKTNETAVPTRLYKDSVFRMLFSDKERLLNLYNALNGTNYTDPDELEINTLENAIYLGRKNDISFIIHSQMYLYEHQSTVNPNMPLRNLFYVASLFTRMVTEKNLLSKQPIHLPKPYFVVFYNGTEEQPERRLLRLSELYEPKVNREMIRLAEEQPELELKTLVININKGYNKELKKSCRDLYEYMVYVVKVREYAKDYPLEKAVKNAIAYCIKNGILAAFLLERRAEVMSMSIFEYNQELHFRQIAEENQEAGWKKGHQEGETQGKMMEKLSNLKSLMETLGLTAEQAMKALKVPEEEQEKYMKMLNQ